VLPGGHADPDDSSLEAAVAREIVEELAGEVEVLGLIHIEESDDERQFFYLGRIGHWSFADRTGHEFSEDGRGEYALDEIPLTLEALSSIDLKPAEIADFVRAAIADGDLFSLPDLRPSNGISWPFGSMMASQIAAVAATSPGRGVAALVVHSVP
jgi:8-oxo-dGTP pyrophosphatase MutT (NUDIX family)